VRFFEITDLNPVQIPDVVLAFESKLCSSIAAALPLD
jgi:hypothetical protein